MRTKRDIPNTHKKEIIRRYRDLGYGQIKTGQIYGYGVHIVKQILQEANVPIRNFSEAASRSNANRAIDVNHCYFDTQNARMAYVLGLLASDGTVRKDVNEIKLTLQALDTDFLEHLKNELGYKGAIRTYTTKLGYSNSTLAFTSAHIKQVLATYNIVPNKTYSFQFPAKLERRFWLDFFRGYFDGDGTVCTAGSGAIRLSMCSYTSNILEVFINFFFEEYGIPKVNIQTKGEENVNYYFQYSTNATKRFYEILYYPNCLHLPRKFEKFTNLVNKFSTRL